MNIHITYPHGEELPITTMHDSDMRRRMPAAPIITLQFPAEPPDCTTELDALIRELEALRRRRTVDCLSGARGAIALDVPATVSATVP